MMIHIKPNDHYIIIRQYHFVEQIYLLLIVLLFQILFEYIWCQILVVL
eukprot:UN07363